jgi:hypothetical protein
VNSIYRAEAHSPYNPVALRRWSRES